MSIYKLFGTKQDQQVYIAKLDENNKESKKLDSGNINNVQINRITYKDFTNEETQEVNTTWNVFFTTEAGKTHILSMGGGMIALNTVNFLVSMNVDERVDLSFYTNKKGYNSTYHKTTTGELLKWKISMGEQKKLIKSETVKIGKTEKRFTDKSEFVDALKKYTDEANEKFPKAPGSAGESFEDEDSSPTSTMANKTVGALEDGDFPF